MKTFDEICAELKEREQFHLDEEQVLTERCQVLAGMYEDEKRKFAEFKEHIRKNLEEYVALAKKGIVRDSIIRDFYAKEFEENKEDK